MTFKKPAAITFMLVFILCVLSACGKNTHSHSSPESGQEDLSQEKDSSSGGFLPSFKDLFGGDAPTTPYSFDALKNAVDDCVRTGSEKAELRFLVKGSVKDDITATLEADINRLFHDTFSIAFFTDSVSYQSSLLRNTLTVTMDFSYNERLAEYEEYFPGGQYYAGAWSEDALTHSLLSAAAGKKGSFTAVYEPSEGTDRSSLLAAAGQAENENEYLQYYIRSSDGKAWDFDDALVLSLSINYNGEASDVIYDIDGLSDLAVVDHMIDVQTDWTEKYVMHYTGEMDWEHIASLAEVASANDCYDLACLMDTYYTSEYSGTGGTVTELTCAFPEDLDDREACLAEMRAAIDAEAVAVDEDYAEDDAEGRYLAVIWRLCDLITYDDGLADAITRESYTEEQQYALTAWGALCRGETVCSGYAAAFKAICDRLGLPCWVVNGEVDDDPLNESEGHAWNAVYLDGTVYFVDITFYDATGDDSYLFFTDPGMNGRTMDESWLLPWE